MNDKSDQGFSIHFPNKELDITIPSQNVDKPGKFPVIIHMPDVVKQLKLIKFASN